MSEFSTPDTGTGSMSITDAAASLDQPTQEEQLEDFGTEVEDAAEALEEAEDEIQDETSDDEDESDMDDSEEDDGDPEEDDEEEDEPQSEYVTVKVDGKETQVTLDELKSGYSRTQDYTRKTQELATQRKAMEQENEAVRYERQQYAQLLGQLQAQLQTEQEPDWESLRQSDPIEYSIQVADWQRKAQMSQAAEAEQQRLFQIQQAEQQRMMAQQVQMAQEKLMNEIPGWSDKTKSKEIKQQIREQALKIGFSDEELKQVYDPRAVLAIHKAAMYDQLMSKKANLKPQKPSTSTVKSGKKSTTTGRTDVKRAKQNLSATGDIRSAVALLNLMER